MSRLKVKQYVSLSVDGTTWCALLGPNKEEGKAGYGESVSEALRNLADLLGWEEIKSYEVVDVLSNDLVNTIRKNTNMKNNTK